MAHLDPTPANEVNVRQMGECLDEMIPANIPTMIWGAPGVGKSELTRQAGERAGLFYCDFRANLREPVDMRGLPSADGETTRWVRPNDLPFVGNDHFPDNTLLHLDELNTASISVLNACLGLIQDRRIGDHVLKPGVRIVAGGNRTSDRAAVTRMPSPVNNRLAHFTVVPDLDIWIDDYARPKNIPALLIAALNFRKGLFHAMPGERPGDDLPAIPLDAKSFPTPRGWASVAKVLNAPDSVRHALITSIVGPGPAQEIEGFMRAWRGLPSVSAIEADPERTPVPTEPSSLAAIAYHLASKATTKTFPAFITYTGRIGRDFEIVMVREATKRDPYLCNTPAYVAYARRNSHAVV